MFVLFFSIYISSFIEHKQTLSKDDHAWKTKPFLEVGQVPFALAVGAGGGCLDSFSLVYHFSLLSPSLGDGPI